MMAPERSFKLTGSRKAGGFTLIEVLISTVILGMLITLAMLSYSHFLDGWRTRRLTEDKVFRQFQDMTLLRHAVESAYDYYVTTPAKEEKGLHFPYFDGEPTAVAFVTLSSVFHKGEAALAKLSTKVLKTGETCLVYEEAFLGGTFVKYQGTEIEYSRQLVVVDNVRSVAFTYYGLFESGVDGSANYYETNRWQDHFSGEEKSTLPLEIEMVVVSGAGKQQFRYPVHIRNAQKNSFFNPML